MEHNGFPVKMFSFVEVTLTTCSELNISSYFPTPSVLLIFPEIYPNLYILKLGSIVIFKYIDYCRPDAAPVEG